MNDNYDIAIIGAGIAGLTAGAILSKAGLRTVIFEKEDQAGGYLVSFKRGDFVFDASLQWLNQCRPGGFVFRIHNHLGGDGPRYKTMHRIHRYNGAGRSYLLTTNPRELRDSLIRDYPQEAAGLKRMFHDAEILGKHMLFLDNRMRGVGTMSASELIRHGVAMTRWVWPIRKYVSVSATEGLARYFVNDELRSLFHSEGTLMSVLVPLGFAFTGDFQNPPDGGSSMMIDGLCRKFTETGGTLCLNQSVREVLVNNRKEATGVRLASGAEVQTRYVIAACDAETLFEKMLPDTHISGRWRKRLRDADLFYSSFSIYIGLDCAPESLGMDEELIRLTDDKTPPHERSDGDARTTVITVLSPSFRDPSLAPQGKGTLLIQCPAYLKHEGNWRTGPGLERGEAYRKLKQEYADILIDRVEKALIPGLRSHIELTEIATPVTFQRYTGNRDGSIMGHKPTRKNIHVGLATINTPVKRLLLGGQWAEYGGGVPMATKAAVNASLAILKDLKPAAFDTLKKVVDGTVTPGLTIGIPRALYYYYYPALWETFFRRLGINTMISDASTNRTVEQAALISESEHCLPLKLLDAHLAQLIGRVDMLFVPRISSGLKGHIACPKLSALPDVAIAQFGDRIKVLTIDIHEGNKPLAESLLELGRLLGADDTAIQEASREALEALRVARLSPARQNGRKHLLILAHPYNLHDEYISGPILTSLKRLDVDVQLMPFGADEVPPGPVKWDTCSKMYHHLQKLDPADCAAVIQLTSFNCGCDSIAMAYHRDILRNKGIPYMTLVVDEHAAQTGIDTRLEAFVDSTRWQGK